MHEIRFRSSFKGSFLNNSSFYFDEITISDIEEELKKLDSSKTAQESDIPTKINKDNIDIFSPILYQEFNKSIETGKFPSEMKSADVTQVFKKEDRTKKDNHRPISVLPNLSKVFERCIYSKLSLYFDNIYPNTGADLERVLKPKIV